MSIKRYSIFDDFFYNLNDDLALLTSSDTSIKRVTYNPDEYDLVPKKGLIEKQLKEAEQRLSSLKAQLDNVDKYYQEQIKAVTLKIDQLKKKL